MREIKVTTFITLDGVMQGPGGPEEDRSGGFAYGGWIGDRWDETLDQEMGAFMGRPFDLLLGRRTYDIFAGYWPSAPDELGGAPLNKATKYVASRGRPNLTWDRSVLLEGDVADAVRALKQTDGPELQVHGSGDLIQTLIRANLVDEWHLMVFPVLIGSGKRLFADGTVPGTLRLVDGRVTQKGVFVATYQPAGELVTASIA